MAYAPLSIGIPSRPNSESRSPDICDLEIFVDAELRASDSFVICERFLRLGGEWLHRDQSQQKPWLCLSFSV
jgi:pantothenate kinase